MFGLDYYVDNFTITGLVTFAAYMAMFAMCFFSKKCRNSC